MTKKFSYDQSFSPPAPVLPIKIQNPWSGLTIDRPLVGILDTGADMTVLPNEAVERLGLPRRGTMSVRGHGDRPLYYTNIEIAGHTFDRLKVITLERSNILIGRDILNQLKLLLNGKKLQFEVIE